MYTATGKIKALFCADFRADGGRWEWVEQCGYGINLTCEYLGIVLDLGC
jgi:hypothetical protein